MIFLYISECGCPINGGFAVGRRNIEVSLYRATTQPYSEEDEIQQCMCTFAHIYFLLKISLLKLNYADFLYVLSDSPQYKIHVYMQTYISIIVRKLEENDCIIATYIIPFHACHFSNTNSTCLPPHPPTPHWNMKQGRGEQISRQPSTDQFARTVISQTQELIAGGITVGSQMLLCYPKEPS